MDLPRLVGASGVDIGPDYHPEAVNDTGQTLNTSFQSRSGPGNLFGLHYVRAEIRSLLEGAIGLSGKS